MSFIRPCITCGKDVEVRSAATHNVKCLNCRKRKEIPPYLVITEDTDELVFCRLCGVARSRLEKHLKSAHALLKEGYIQQFPEAPLESKKSKESRKRSKQMKEINSQKMLDYWDEHREERIESHPGSWNKGLKMSKTQCEKVRATANKLVTRSCKICGTLTETKAAPGHNGVLCSNCKQQKTQQKDSERIKKLLEKHGLKEEDLIVCAICNFKTLFLSHAHLKQHNLTASEYKEKFPNSLLTSPALRKISSKRMSGENHHFFGTKVSKTRKNKIRAGVNSFNDTRKKVCKTPLCSREFYSPFEDYCKICRSKIFIEEDTEDLVRCRICSAGFGCLASHLLAMHNISTDDYLQKYPGAFLVAKSTAKKISLKHNPAQLDLKVDEYKVRDYGPNWRLQARRARIRDDYTCHHCSKTKENKVRICVHHKIPFILFDDYKEANQLSNLICLCTSCHQKEEHKFWETLTQEKFSKFEDKIDQIEVRPKICAWLSKNEEVQLTT